MSSRSQASILPLSSDSEPVDYEHTAPITSEPPTAPARKKANRGKRVLGLVRELCRALENGEIAYCHWKSNNALDRSASGENDLDLLVSRADITRFREELCRLDFKRWEDPPGRRVPGIESYYGFDVDSGKLVHVHAHYQLVLGHDATKNYRCPVERAYLASAVQRELFRVPRAELEIIVFVMRMVLKHSTWDAILLNEGTLSGGERDELAYLHRAADRDSIKDMLNQHLPMFDIEFFERCLKSLEHNAPRWERIRVGWLLKAKLQSNTRRSPTSDLLLKLGRRIGRSIQRRMGGVPKSRLSNGGAMIAIVGGDGAGKSTMLAELDDWLSKEFETLNIHLGKPRRSWTTSFIRGSLKIARSIGALNPANWLLGGNAASKVSSFPGYSYAWWQACVARDRYLTYVKARRFVARGGLVLCDRFPLHQIKLMDGPQLERTAGQFKDRILMRFLIGLEKKWYRSIVEPELLVVLRLDPSVAVARKTDEEPESVRVRSQEVWKLHWDNTHAEVIDALPSKEEVLSRLKSVVWSHL